MRTRLYEYEWKDGDTDEECRFVIFAGYYAQTQWRPEDECIISESYFIEEEPVQYFEFKERTGMSHDDMMINRYLREEDHDHYFTEFA